jgi:hypothetical protein
MPRDTDETQDNSSSVQPQSQQVFSSDILIPVLVTFGRLTLDYRKSKCFL